MRKLPGFSGSGMKRSVFQHGTAAMGVALGAVGLSRPARANEAGTTPMATPPKPKPATAATKAANAEYLNGLNFNDTTDFTDAKKGFIAALPEPAQIKNDQGAVVWDLGQYEFIKPDPHQPAPDTVNPSLWRLAKLNMCDGLFKVTDGLWQVRGYDLSVMSIIQGTSGYIVIDPFISAEVAKAVWQQLVIPHIGDKPITAVIHTHSHVDHYGGVHGIVDRQDIASGKVSILAPEKFTEAAVAENVIAGNAMSRRATYMYGNLIPKNPTGQVDGGLGKTTSAGTVTMALPTDWATKTGQVIALDGVELHVIMAPESEAPSEFMFYIPSLKAFCAAEDATHTLHNLYTLRGAKVRDGLLWSKYLQSALDMFGDEMEIVFASHHWPTWGNTACVELLTSQRDMYRYLHDQVMRLANSGYTPLEIGDTIRLPQSQITRWPCRSYYGTVYHDAVAQYNLRLGFYDGVPANLHRHQPVEAGKRYVAFMGGADNVLKQAQASYDQGDYRWVAEVVNHVVFADPNNEAARALLADAYEQLGYQAESGPWRNVYLCGAEELRSGVKQLPTPTTASPDTIRVMPVEMFLDYLGVRLNPEKAGDAKVVFNLNLTDTNEKWTFGVENGALHHSQVKQAADPNTTMTMTRTDLNDIMLGNKKLQQQIVAGKAKVEGDPAPLSAFVSWLDPFPFWFNIVTP
jgi:alkyl sulfatase BDS1-like metallo-beta-lactamase superfamily hydrolase